MARSISRSRTPHVSAWRAFGTAARVNVVPGLVLWLIGLALVLAYYYSPAAQPAFVGLMQLRERWDILFPIVTTALSGAILPILYLRRDPTLRASYRGKNIAVLTLFWAYKGAEVELWYRFLAVIVGPGHDFRTIAFKTLLDQAVYSPFFAVPVTVLVLGYHHVGLRLAPIMADLRAGHWYRRHVVPTLLANAIIWVPVVCLVYALPLALQVLLFDLVLCFYMLIIAHLTRRRPH